MYVAVKGGEKAIDNAHLWLAEERRGDVTVSELSLKQITEQLGLAVNRVMAEGSLYDRELAALAIKQSRGDLIEAIFLLRAYRTTLPRFGTTKPINTNNMYYFSRSRQKLWQKGETSGHFQKLFELRLDCDNDTMLALIEQTGPACHTGAASCFFKSTNNINKD